jgi:16S rRNA (adenine1518-N6/adenine1519-N6)-dimethyltransferase
VAKKSLGQNFLVDPNAQRAIADAIHPGPDDELLEIGPGRGALTQRLAGRVRRLLLVELDNQLAAALTARFSEDNSVTVIHEDFMEVDLDAVSEDVEQLKVIGNIPYNITSPIIFRLLERRPRPRAVVLMIQREVADRILAQPGSKAFGALAVGVRAVADVERVLNVGRGAFRPAPDVDSTVIRITPHQPPRLTPEVEVALRTLTRAAFGQRRKQLQRILRDAYGLSPDTIEGIARRVGFDPRDRPETLQPTTFVQLAEALLHLTPQD